MNVFELRIEMNVNRCSQFFAVIKQQQESLSPNCLSNAKTKKKLQESYTYIFITTIIMAKVGTLALKSRCFP